MAEQKLPNKPYVVKYKNNEEYYRCPLCGCDFAVSQGGSFICNKNHCFDISKKGYINFVPGKKEDKFYNKDFFTARSQILAGGHYDRLVDEICAVMLKHVNPEEAVNIIDAGSGEGFYSLKIYGRFTKANIFALDIVKDALVLAAREKNKINWIVGDIAKIPLKDNVADVILNIFSPANYGEFKRLLKTGGVIIKVTPGKEYLKEIRQAVLKKHSPVYDDEEVKEYFSENVKVTDTVKLKYKAEVNPGEIGLFKKMSPILFTAETDEAKMRAIKRLTMDFNIIAGRF